jgi:D-serine deaminase-like pyridoxal phosphate-dependent protein
MNKGVLIMKKTELQTPAILVDLDVLNYNINRYQELCDKSGKRLWPMVKTHKSIEMIDLQLAAGADGFLCGTLDECEKLCAHGVRNIMYAYPVASDINIRRVMELAKKCNFIIRIDSFEAAEMLNSSALEEGVKINYTIIVDSGLHRFGIAPGKAASFADSIKGLQAMVFKGISTHPGHVYSATRHDEVQKFVDDEKNALKTASDALRAAGYAVELITTGSTPTFFGSLLDENINVLHPGNYVFNDYIQLSIETVKESECSLSVYATVISHPSPEVFICDAGTKCLGLDQGAHGNTSIKGHGYVKGHPELIVDTLSEEVGKLHVQGSTTLRIGDKIEIIPNHACSSANLTKYLIGCRGDEAEKLIEIDMRGNSTVKNFK